MFALSLKNPSQVAFAFVEPFFVCAGAVLNCFVKLYCKYLFLLSVDVMDDSRREDAELESEPVWQVGSFTGGASLFHICMLNRGKEFFAYNC